MSSVDVLKANVQGLLDLVRDLLAVSELPAAEADLGNVAAVVELGGEQVGGTEGRWAVGQPTAATTDA